MCYLFSIDHSKTVSLDNKIKSFYGVEHDTYYILGFVGNQNVVERARVIYNGGRYEEEGFYTSQVNMMSVFTEMLEDNGYKNNWCLWRTTIGKFM